MCDIKGVCMYLCPHGIVFTVNLHVLPRGGRNLSHAILKKVLFFSLVFGSKTQIKKSLVNRQHIPGFQQPLVQ